MHLSFLLFSFFPKTFPMTIYFVCFHRVRMLHRFFGPHLVGIHAIFRFPLGMIGEFHDSMLEALIVVRVCGQHALLSSPMPNLMNPNYQQHLLFL